MAYGQKYLFKWESIHKVEYQIRILKDGYSGSVIQRHLGGAPVLKMQQNGCVRGTSLQFKAECAVDGEFAELYTSDPKEFQVEVYRAGTKIWSGFITPEIYSEPDIAPPYDVDVVATDGLGELKLYDFPKNGKQSIRTHLYNILSNTGQSLEIYYVSQIHTGSVTDVNFLRTMEMNLDYMAGESCYDVLDLLLETLHATITYSRGTWFIVRETDFEVTGTSIRAIAAGTRAQSSATTVANAVYSLGQMGVADMWPVGYSSTSIVPAKKRVVVEAPWHVVNGLVNPDFASATGWETPESPYGDTSQYISSIPAMLLGYTYQAIVGTPFGKYLPTCIAQEVSLAPLAKPMKLDLKASGYYTGNYKANRLVEVRILFTDVNSNVYYLEPGSNDDSSSLLWVASETNGRAVTVALSSNTTAKENADSITIDIPVFPYSVSGTLRIEIYGQAAYILNAELTVVMNKGYRDVVNLQNGARGEDDTREILIGRETSDTVLGVIPFLNGILLYNNASVSSLSDGNFSSLDFLALTARGYALSVALPRLQTQGHFNMPSSKTYAPILVSVGNVLMEVQSYDWDLLEEELDLTAVSLPAASITVQTEKVESMGDAEIIAGGGSTSSSGGGGGGGGGGTGTVTSVGMTVPTGLSVSGSPITTSGTFAVTYSTGYAIPKTADVNKGVTAYGWGNHANAGYLTTVTESMIISALGYTPISPSILSQDLSYYATIEQLAGLGLSAPVLQIVRGHNGDGAIDPYLEAFHPMVGDGNFNADFVLMVWSPRRGRKPLGVDASKYRRGWGEARGNGANLTEISFGSSADGMCRGQVTLQTLRLHVLHRYLCGRNQALATVHAMNWQTFVQSGQDGYDYGFGGLNNYSGTKTNFYKKVSRHRMFGIALRVENPAFADAVSGTPDITTRSIADPNNTNHYIPRYYYSAVTPFRVIINRDGDQNNTIGFQLQPICAPMKP